MKKTGYLGFALGPIAMAILGLASVPIMTWIFSPDDIGRLNVFQNLVSFLLIFSVLGLDQAYVREYHEAPNKPSLLRNCALPGLAVAISLTLLSLPIATYLADLFYDQQDPVLYLITAVTFLLGFLSRFSSLILRMQGRGLAYSISQILPKIAQLLIVGIFAIFASIHREFLQLLLISLAAAILVFVLFCNYAKKEWRLACQSHMDWQMFRKLTAFGIPLIFSGLAYWGLNATGTFALKAFSNLAELAVYSVAISFAGAMSILQSIFSVVWSPIVYKWLADGNDMRRIDEVTQQVLAVVCAAITLCGTLAWTLDYLLPPQYEKVKFILACCAMQPMLYLLSEITCVGIAVTRRTIFSFWITIAAVVSNICMSILLVPLYGATGAAISNVTAFLVFFVGRTEVSAALWRKFPQTKLYLSVFSIVALSVLTALYAYRLPSVFNSLWLLAFIVQILAFKKQWVEMLAIILKSIRNKLIDNRESRSNSI
jgi:O-antigen/teichoic acid export membrane protein